MNNPKIDITILLPSNLPVPDIFGGAIEGLMTILLNQNELINNFTFHFILKSTPNNILFEKNILHKYKNSNFFFIPDSKFSFLLKPIDRLLTKFNPRLNLSNLIYVKKVSKLIKKLKPHHLLVEGNISYSKIILMNKPISSFFHLHSDYSYFNLEIFRRYINLYNKIIVVSQFLKNRLIEKFNIDENKIFVLKNQIDTTYFTKDKLHLKNKKDYFTIGYVGRISSEKGIFLLLDSFIEISKKINIKLIIAGSSSFKLQHKSKDFTKFMLLIKSIKNIEYLGYIDRKFLHNFYSKIDLLVFPSVGLEAAGLVPLESLSFGVPVFSSSVGGIKEYLHEKFVFFTTHTNSVKDFSTDLFNVIINKEIFLKKKEIIKNEFLLAKPIDYYLNFTKIIKL